MGATGKRTWARFAERALVWAFFLGCRAPTTSITIAAPVGVGPAKAWSTANPVRSNDVGMWAREIPIAPGFARHELHFRGPVLLEWRLESPLPVVPCDLNTTMSQTLALEVRSDLEHVTIPLGALGGFPETSALSYCASTTAQADVVSKFTSYASQSATQFLAIRDGRVLHIAKQNVPTMVECHEKHYGPLASCAHHEWTRVAEIDVGMEHLYEVAVDHDHVVDCNAPTCTFP